MASKKIDNDLYIKLALSSIPEHFSGKLLEVPVGTGVLSLPMYKNLKNADITCLDYSQEMMATAQRRSEAFKLSNIHFLQADVGSLPFKNES